MLTLIEANALLAILDEQMLAPDDDWYDEDTKKG